MKKILITGGAGFIGFHIAKELALKDNNEITIVDNLLRGRSDLEFQKLINKKNVKFINGDITNPKIFYDLGYDFDYIYHLVAVIGVKNVMNNPDKVLSVNAISILNMFEYAKHLPNLKKILFSSTSEIYSGTMKHYGIKIPTNEEVNLTIEDIKSPRTTYALSKMFGESVCYNYGRKFNIPFTIVRYHNVYGPRMGFAHVIPELIYKIHHNNTIDLPSSKHTRAFCYIDDAVEMTIKCCEGNDVNEQIFNIGNSQEEIQIGKLIDLIAETMNKKIEVNEITNTLGSTPRRCPDTGKINDYFDLKQHTTINQGIEKTYQWYRDKLNNPFE